METGKKEHSDGMTIALAASELRSHFSRLLSRSGLLLCRCCRSSFSFCRSSFSFRLWCLFTLLRLALSCWLRLQVFTVTFDN